MKRIYILIFSLVFLSCGKSEKNNNAVNEKLTEDNSINVTKAQFDTEQMQLSVLTEESFNKTVKVNGFTDVPPQNRASVSTLISGYIKKTPLLIGDKVKKGQYLVTLENIEFVEIQQQYLEVSEKLSYLKSEFERQQTLFNEKITSQKNYLKAESTYKSTLAIYNGLRKKLTMMNISPTSVEAGKISSKVNIYAPIAGYITKVNVTNGAYVSPSDEILEIVNTDHIHLELAVFEKDILMIKKEQPISFKMPEASDEMFKADVHLVGTSVNEEDRTIKVHGHIKDDNQANFVIGMFVEAEIVTAVENGLAIPSNAIVEIENSFFALVLTDQKEDVFTFEKVKLSIGKKSEAFVEILNADDFKDKKVLTKGVFMLVVE